MLDSLLRINVRPDLIDIFGNSAIFYGIESKNYYAIPKLLEKGGILKTSTKRLFDAIRECDIELLHGLQKFGYRFENVDV